MSSSAIAGSGTIMPPAPLAKSLPTLSSSEKAFLRVMADTVSGSDSFSLQHVCDLFMYDRALKIESMVRDLKISVALPRSEQFEAQFYLRQFKLWAKQHKEELLSEFFICKFSLMQSIASDHPKILFKPPFFHDLALLKRRGLVRFLKYDRSLDFPLFLKHVSKSVGAAFNTYIDELKTASQIYSRASISRPDCLSLHEPIFSYFDTESLATLSLNGSQILFFILFLTDMSLHAANQDHITIKLPMIDELRALALQGPGKDKMWWQHLESRLYQFVSVCMNQKEIFRRKLLQAMNGALTYKEFCTSYKIIENASYTHEIFCSLLHQYASYCWYMGESCEKLLSLTQPFIKTTFGDASIPGRYLFDAQAYKAALATATFFKDLKPFLEECASQRLLIDLLDEDLQQKHSEILESIRIFNEDIDIVSSKNIHEEFFNFLSSFQSLGLGTHLVVKNRLFLRQFEDSIKFHHKNFNSFAEFVDQLERFFSTQTIPLGSKAELAKSLERLVEGLFLIQRNQMWLYQSSYAMFEDTVYEMEEPTLLYSEGFTTLDWSSILKEPALKPSAASAASVAAAAEEDKERTVTAESIESLATVESGSRASPVSVHEAAEELELPRKNTASRKVFHILSSLGFEMISQSGSHAKLRHTADHRTVILPMGKEALPQGTLKSIWEQAGLL